MHPYRRYDRIILNCVRRAQTVEQIERTMRRASLTDFSAEDIQVRCEVLRRAGRLRIRSAGQGRSAYELCDRADQGRLRVPPSSNSGLRVTLMAGAVVSAMGCSALGSGSAPLFPEDMPRYHTERVPSLSRVYQVPGQVVYRLCATIECPMPTPKVRVRTAPLEHASENTQVPPPALAQASPLPPLEAQSKQPSSDKEVERLNSAEIPEPASRAAIFFGFASAKLSADSLETLKRQASVIKAAKRIVLVGRTDHVGSMERNKLFAKKRADAIREALLALGVSKETISVEIDPKTTEALHPRAVSASKPTDEAAQARRVDILIH